MTEPATCATCFGTGELSSEVGPHACPDCGGTGQLPSRSTLVEWRARDLDLALTAGRALEMADARWLLAELRVSRSALAEVVALANELDDANGLATRIRQCANVALGLYEAERPASKN